jgi:hypothetical protein
MTLARYVTCKDIVNRAAVECGLNPIADVFGSVDPAFISLRTLLTSCGQNLCEAYEWEQLRRQFSYTTINCDVYLDHGVVTGGPFVLAETITGGTSGATGVTAEVGTDYVAISGIVGTFQVGETITGGTSLATAVVSAIRDNGEYNLPDDFDRMIDQTHWDRTNRVPVAGPLSPQQWQYLLGMQLANQTIYATFRVMEGLFNLLPQPPPIGLSIVYEYVSLNWIQDAVNPTQFHNVADANDDIVLFKPEMIIQFLRYKFLSAKGFASNDAQKLFAHAFQQTAGGDKGAPILNAGRMRRAGMGWLFVFLSMWNVPDTGYGISAKIFTENGDTLILDGEGGINYLLQEQNTLE